MHYTRERMRSGRLPVATRVYQGLGALPEALKTFAFNTFLLLFYNQVLGLAASVASVALLVAVLVDAVTDPLVGSLSDRTRARLGRRHPYMFAAVVPLGLSLWLLFSPPGSLTEAGLAVWLGAFAVATRVSMTFFQVPWSALFVELTDDYVERSELVTYRWGFAIIGVALFTALSWAALFQGTEALPEGQLDRSNYPAFAVVLAALVAGAALLTALLTRREVPYLLQPTDAPAFRLTDAFRDLRLSLRNANFRRLFIGLLFTATLTGTVEATNIYISTYFWELTPSDLAWYALAALGAFAGIAAVPMLNRRYEKRTLLVVGMLASIALGPLLVSLRFLDVLPANGEPALLRVLVCVEVLRGFLLVIVGTMFVSMTADTADQQEVRTGLRQEGVFSAAVSFSNKAISGLGILFAGLLIDHVIQLGAGVQPGEVPQDTLVRLGVTMGYLVPALYLLPLFVLVRYDLTRERHETVIASLEARRITDADSATTDTTTTEGANHAVPQATG